MAQKFSLVDNTAHYARKHRSERDRPGGHVPMPVKQGLNGWREYFGPVGRKSSKKLFAKQARREQARITAEAVQEWKEYNISNTYDDYDVYDIYNDYCDDYDYWLNYLENGIHPNYWDYIDY